MSESERFAHMFDKSVGLVKKWSDIRLGLMFIVIVFIKLFNLLKIII